MSAWRRIAIQNLPELGKCIAGSDNPMALWIDLFMEFEDAIAKKDTSLIVRLLKYADWSASEQSGALPNESSNAVSFAFYMGLAGRKEFWSNFNIWFSASQIEDLMPIFCYHLKPDVIADFKLAISINDLTTQSR